MSDEHVALVDELADILVYPLPPAHLGGRGGVDVHFGDHRRRRLLRRDLVFTLADGASESCHFLLADFWKTVHLGGSACTRARSGESSAVCFTNASPLDVPEAAASQAVSLVQQSGASGTLGFDSIPIAISSPGIMLSIQVSAAG